MSGWVRFLWVATVVWAALGGHPVSAQGMEDVAALEIVVETRSDVVFEPEKLLQVIEGTEHHVKWYTILPDVARVTATVEDEMVAEVRVVGEVGRGTLSDNFTYYGHFNVSALFIGYNKVYVTLYDRLDVVAGNAVLDMSVLLSYQDINDIFILLLGIIVSVVYVFMGATIDFNIIKSIAKKPVGPLVGICCQYLFMPLIAFGLGKIAFPGNALAQLGLFLMGCSPGGGASNMWTYLLGGSLDLSIMMTFFSTVVAFGAVPLWVLMLGEVIMSGAEFVIPYKDIAVLVVSLSIPCLIGLLIQRYLPKVAKIMGMLLTPLTLFNIIFVFTFGIYAHLYVFSIFDVKSVLSGFALPALGYLSGLGLASFLKLPGKDRIAISVETGIQNGAVAIFILKFTLEKPAGNLTVVFPAAVVIMSPIPLVIALIIRRIYLCRTGAKGSKEEDGKTIGAETAMEDVKKETEEVVEGRRRENGGTDNPSLEMSEEMA